MKQIFSKLAVLICACAAFAACQSGGTGKAGAIKTPETSKLFEKRVDSISGVVSYALKYGAPDDNRQSLYFVTKSMTEDGRFLVFMYTEGNEKKGHGPRHTMVADLLKEEVFDLGEIRMTPFIETREDYMVYGDVEKGFFRRDFATPDQEIKLCDIPEALTSLGRIRSLATHMTMTQDRKKAFLDLSVNTPEGKTRYLQGLLDITNGEWELWGETDWICNHGQLNPVDDNLAMCAWESAWEAMGRAYQDSTGWYPRMWLVRKGSKTLIPAEARNFASHEIWDDDGKGLSWCGHGQMIEEDCVYHLDLETGRQEVWAKVPGARHNNCSPDNKYVVCDQAPERWWRGCRWRVAFWNRETGKYVWIYSTRDALMPQNNPSTLHPDPHPHFVMNGRYVVSTANNADGHMDLFVTPVDQLIEMTK
ncbi:MAG: hypothetical protein K6F98_01600 [Bacteroidales bacterium]|nr:hypothetical protein [Bacteroidales bacterium]